MQGLPSQQAAAPLLQAPSTFQSGDLSIALVILVFFACAAFLAADCVSTLLRAVVRLMRLADRSTEDYHVISPHDSRPVRADEEMAALVRTGSDGDAELDDSWPTDVRSTRAMASPMLTPELTSNWERRKMSTVSRGDKREEPPPKRSPRTRDS